MHKSSIICDIVQTRNCQFFLILKQKISLKFAKCWEFDADWRVCFGIFYILPSYGVVCTFLAKMNFRLFFLSDFYFILKKNLKNTTGDAISKPGFGSVLTLILKTKSFNFCPFQTLKFYKWASRNVLKVSVASHADSAKFYIKNQILIQMTVDQWPLTSDHNLKIWMNPF